MGGLENCSAEEILALARLNFRKENFEGALVKLKLLLSRGGAPVEAYNLLGRLYRMLELVPEAKNCFQFYLTQCPDAVAEQFQLGLCEQDLGNIGGAAELYDAALHKDGEYAPALYQRAILYAESGQVAAALEKLNHLIETADDSDPYIPLADRLIVRLEEDRDKQMFSRQ